MITLLENFYTLCANLTLMNKEYDLGLLPSVDSSNFFVPSESIFFHETSLSGDLSPRQACAVESAARAHPSWQINVLFSDLTEKYLQRHRLSKTVALLRKFPNIVMARLNTSEYSKGTPLESLIADGALLRSNHPKVHTADILRVLTLFKFGGIYLDLDVIVVKSLEALGKNWAAREDEQSVNNACLAFSRKRIGRKVAKAVARYLAKHFQGDGWGINGPSLITGVLFRDICKTAAVKDMSSATCDGFAVYGPELFYAVPYINAKKFFVPDEILPKDVFAYHLWNYITKDEIVRKNSPLDKLGKSYCPTIHGHSHGKI